MRSSGDMQTKDLPQGGVAPLLDLFKVTKFGSLKMLV
jgi:hypothetical protein